MSAPRITVAVVTYNSEEVIAGFLDALALAMADFDDYEVVVVDNCSRDATEEIVTSSAAHATWIPMATNAGYAAGINAAVAATRSEAVLIANPDTRPAPGTGTRLWHAIEQPGVGIAAPRLVGEDGRLQHSLRRDATVMRVLGEALLGGTRASRFGRLSQVVGDDTEYEHSHDVEWASGALLLVSRACLDATGPWDESFFLYSEEEDFQQRARSLGFGVRYVADACAVHVGGEMHVAPALWALSVVNKLRLYARTHGSVATLAFRAALAWNEVVRVPRSPAHRQALRALCSRDALTPRALTPGARP